MRLVVYPGGSHWNAKTKEPDAEKSTRKIIMPMVSQFIQPKRVAMCRQRRVILPSGWCGISARLTLDEDPAKE